LLNSSNCYKILGVSETASFKEIKQAYRKLSLQYHPDKNDNDGQKFKEVNEAYQFLKSERKKEDNRIKKEEGKGYAEFWKYQEENSEGFRFYNTQNSSKFMNDFNVNEFQQQSHNKEKPISQKITHFILYSGLAIITAWIILLEILK